MNLKELNLICWGLFVAFLVLPVGFVLHGKLKAGELPRSPEVDFIYVYGMGRIFNEYPAAEAYDYELQKRICNEVHPQRIGAYGPIPYSPFVGILFRPFARLPFVAAYLLWVSMSFVLYVAGLAILSGRFFPHDGLRRSLIFFMALTFYPFINWTMISGHLSTIGFFAMALALREEDLSHPIRSGLALSICLYKPTLIVLLLPMLFVTKRFKTLAGFVAGGLTLTLFATAVEGARVWPGYITMLLDFARGSAGIQTASFKQAWKYVDFASFASLIPGGRSWLGHVLLFGCAFWLAFALICAWWRSAGLGRATNTLVWATTLTWTLVLNVYVPIYDSILVVPALIATAGVLRCQSGTLLYRWFTFTWLLTLAVSWITVDVAQASGFQIITVLFSALGVLQFAALRQLGAQRPLQPPSN